MKKSILLLIILTAIFLVTCQKFEIKADSSVDQRNEIENTLSDN